MPSRFKLKGLPRKLLLAALDMGMLVLAYYVAILLRFVESDESGKIPMVVETMLRHMPWMLAVYFVVFWFGGLYEVMWQYAGMRDLARVVMLACISTGFLLIGNQMVEGVLYRTVLAIGAILGMAAIGGIRLVWRLVRFTLFRPNASVIKNADNPLLVVGAGNAGAWAVNLCKQRSSFGNPVVMVDDDPAKRNLRIQGVPVRGAIDDIPELVREYGIREIVIAITSLRGDRLQQVVNICNNCHCRVRKLNDPQAVDENGNVVGASLRELNTSDFLSRDEVHLDDELIHGYLTDKVVLVTGGGGSIGSELCRQIIRYKPKKLLIFDIYENCAYELEMELKSKYGYDLPLVVLVGSIRDKRRLDEIMMTYHPEVVFHAAAHKHVPLMEVSPAEAVKNNVIGTKNLLSSASEHGVERFVQLSTDKAVNPTNVMGCTKRICEMLIQSFASNTEMKCMAVRFGNVLGSHGSVIPLFEAQIRKGGPVTITHPDIVRYFMTIPEAAQLVLEAGALATSGSIYVLDMGAPVRIMELAEKMIRFYGYEPNVNMEIRITGLRPGEKLYEELMMDTEADKMKRTDHNKIFVAPPLTIDLAVFYDSLKELERAAEHNDDGVVEHLQSMVPTYHPNRNML